MKNLNIPERYSGEFEDLYQEALLKIKEHGYAGTSLLQRALKVGYARASYIMDLLEERKIIEPRNGARPCKLI